MITLRENEKILLEVRKHWFMIAAPSFSFIILFLVPPAALYFLPQIERIIPVPAVVPLAHFILTLYSMVVLLLLFLLWTNYYLDMWIITSERIIDIEQHGLFQREVAEIPLSRVQDVTIEIHGIIETFLKFGTIRIQTAGEREFFIRGVPQLYEIKDAILAYTQRHSESQ